MYKLVAPADHREMMIGGPMFGSPCAICVLKLKPTSSGRSPHVPHSVIWEAGVQSCQDKSQVRLKGFMLRQRSLHKSEYNPPNPKHARMRCFSIQASNTEASQHQQFKPVQCTLCTGQLLPVPLGGRCYPVFSAVARQIFKALLAFACA